MAHHPNPNAAALEHAYARWSETKGGSADEVLASVRRRIEMRSVLAPSCPTTSPQSHSSKAPAIGIFRDPGPRLGDDRLRRDRFIADGDDVVMVGRCAWRNRATGRIVDTPKVDIWHFENGRAVTFLEMFDSLAFARALGVV